MELLSVIVPVYNTEQYLEKCITSIQNQTYINIEIILIDDGSTDNSGKICDKFAAEDERIKVIHKVNGGLVAARKQGVQVSRGKLITFVDGDDFIETEMYEKMLMRYDAEKPDIISSGLKSVRDIDATVLNYELDEFEEGIYNRKEIENRILERMMWDNRIAKRGITSSVCTKIFRRDLINQVIQKVDDRLTLGEDAAITYPCFALADKVIIFHQSWYCYVIRTNSMIREKKLTDFEKIYQFKNCMRNQFGGIDVIKNIEYQIDQYIRVFLKAMISQIFQLDIVRVNYLFPYSLIPKGKRIIIYGAGKVGESYLRCLQDSEYVKVVAVVDKNYANRVVCDRQVGPPSIVEQSQFDYILIAINNQYVAQEIKTLLLRHNVEAKQIIWVKPQWIG